MLAWRQHVTFLLLLSSLLMNLRGKDITKRRKTRRKTGTVAIEIRNEKRRQTAAGKEKKTGSVRERKKGTTETRTETRTEIKTGTEIETGKRTGTRRETRIGSLKKPRRNPRNHLRIRC